MTRHSTGRDDWAAPRAPSDPSLRTRMHGRILPMHEPRARSKWVGAILITAVALTAAAFCGAVL